MGSTGMGGRGTSFNCFQNAQGCDKASDDDIPDGIEHDEDGCSMLLIYLILSKMHL